MLRGSKHFYFILAKTTNEWHMVVHSSTSTAQQSVSSRWFCPAAVPPPSHHQSVMLSSPRTMLLSSDNAVFKDLWSRSPTHIKKRNLHKYSRTESVRATYWSYCCSSRRAGMCVRDLFWKTWCSYWGDTSMYLPTSYLTWLKKTDS